MKTKMMKNKKNKYDLFDVFMSLKNSDINGTSYYVENIDSKLPHRLGCDKDAYPTFFIKCSEFKHISDIKLNIISVLFNRKCKIQSISDQKEFEGNFTVIKLASHNYELVRYFIEVIYLILVKLPSIPSNEELRLELTKVIGLFSNPPQFSKDSIIGLWAELFVILQASQPEYLLRAWHVNTDDKYDFNDSQNKLEIKSTSKQVRKHIFSLEQLNSDSGLLIGSVYVVESGIGKSIFDLEDEIEKVILDSELHLKLKKLILATVASNIDGASKLFFDFSLAQQSLAFYDACIVPSIPKSSIPSEVSGVHFTSDLSECQPFDFSNSDSELFNSI